MKIEKLKLALVWIVLISNFIVFYSISHAAVAFDASATATNNNVGSLTIPLTIGGGCTQPILQVCLAWNDAVVTQATGVTYNSVAMTFVGGTVAAEGVYRVEMWRLVNPATGSSHNVVATLPDSSINTIVGAVLSYCGVDQTTPLGTPATAASDSDPVTVDVASATGDLVTDCALSVSDSIAVGAGQTQRAADSLNNVIFKSSSKPGVNPTTMSYTQTPGTNYWGIVGVSLKPSAVVGRRRIINVHK